MQLVDKAVEAAISAIEIYNKPSFKYREESFSILMLNAWELILKARIIKENKNNIRSIVVFEYKKNKEGKSSKRQTPKRNRARNMMTIGLEAAVRTVGNYPKNALDLYGSENISLLMEIRDNAIHFRNSSRSLRKQVQEIGAATLRNFSFAAKSWFGCDLSSYDFAIMPFAFESPTGKIQTVFKDDSKGPTAKLHRLISETKRALPFDPSKQFNVGIEVELRFVRRAADGAVPVRLVSPDNITAVPITISEEDVRKRFAWTYSDLCKKMRKRYSNYKADDSFHKVRREIEQDPRYCHVRRLDPQNMKGTKRTFYDPNILSEFDSYYKQRS